MIAIILIVSLIILGVTGIFALAYDRVVNATAHCHCHDARSLEAGYVCPLGHTY